MDRRKLLTLLTALPFIPKALRAEPEVPKFVRDAAVGSWVNVWDGPQSEMLVIADGPSGDLYCVHLNEDPVRWEVLDEDAGRSESLERLRGSGRTDTRT